MIAGRTLIHLPETITLTKATLNDRPIEAGPRGPIVLDGAFGNEGRTVLLDIKREAGRKTQTFTSTTHEYEAHAQP